jgi:transposase
MHVAGIDAHATYVVVAIVSNDGALVRQPVRISNGRPDRLLEVLESYRPVEVVVEASPARPWLYDLLEEPGCRFVLAHPKKLRAIAEANYKNDEIDATLLARMQLAQLIPEVYAKPIEQREQATLVRHRARLVRLRSQAASRIHAELHSVGLRMGRGKLLTREGRAWVHTTAWPLFGPEQQRLVRTHERIADGLKKMIRSLDRHIEEVGHSSQARPSRPRSRSGGPAESWPSEPG